ncbi:MAG: folate hydrolase, partial [Acidobacteriaceae bacterium]|nr:folate hydrolase [Acidobacteriaceae bacterium]
DRNRDLEDGVYSATSDPLKPLLPPSPEPVPPHFNFAPVQNAADELAASAVRLEKAWNKHQASGWSLPPERVNAVNALMMQAGPALTDAGGLPGRPWFKNMIYAPGAYTGYEAKPLPGVLEALDRKDWAEAESQIPREAEALKREKKVVDEIIAALKGEAVPVNSPTSASGRR